EKRAPLGTRGMYRRAIHDAEGPRAPKRVSARARGDSPAQASDLAERSVMVARVRLALGCLLLSACAVSCAPGQAESPEVNGRRYFGSLEAPAGQLLRFNLGSEPELRDPGTMSGQPDGRFARLVFEGLTTSDPRT